MAERKTPEQQIEALEKKMEQLNQGFRRLFKPDYRLLVWRRSVGYGIQRPDLLFYFDVIFIITAY